LVICYFSASNFQWDKNLMDNITILFNSCFKPLLILLKRFVFDSNKNSTKYENLRDKIDDLLATISENSKILNVDDSELTIMCDHFNSESIECLMQYSNSFYKNCILSPLNNVISSCLKLCKNSILEYKRLIVDTLMFSFLNDSEASTTENSTSHYYYDSQDDVDKIILALDLDETLIHSISSPSGIVFFLRPGALYFLKALYKKYDLVLFTASTSEYADQIVNMLDPKNKLFKGRHYRSSVTTTGNGTAKNLQYIARNTDKVILIDNLESNFQFQQSNGILVNTWEDDVRDRTLFNLADHLKMIDFSKYNDSQAIAKKCNELLRIPNVSVKYNSGVQSKLNPGTPKRKFL